MKQAGFMVISRATMPSVLIELGFLTNKLEEDFLNSKNGKIYMASAIFRAIKDYKLELEASILENFTSKKEIHELYFSVQFLTSTTPLNLDKLTIQNQDLIYSFYDGNYYKYSYGKVKTLKEVYDLKEKLRSFGYNDFFTIAILNGDKISLADALLILK